MDLPLFIVYIFLNTVVLGRIGWVLVECRGSGEYAGAQEAGIILLVYFSPCAIGRHDWSRRIRAWLDMP